MKQARYKEPLPLAVIEAARAGDAGAVEQVLQYYNGYINKRQISLFFQLLIQIANDLISRCLFYFQKFTYIGYL